MKSKRKALPFKTKVLFTIVGGAVLINPAFINAAYAADQKAAAASDDLEEIVVTGMRASLKASMETKRDAIGVVDAISAEDIGKFPDTNLSEALQRVTGISIDRRSGEGATVTARGFGPQFNMVTLNGRQIPGADAFGSGDTITGGQGSGSRSFNFANLSAEAISAVEVYKTGRADIATGGIGATINIKTAKPFDNTGLVASVGVKANHDTTRNLEGSDVTPEVSGIFSYTDDNKKWGVGLNASYSRRDSGTVEATVNDWHIAPWDPANGGNVPLAQSSGLVINNVPITATVENAPAKGQLFGIPNDIRYAISDIKRERTNAQLTVQFAPTDSITLTADYTFAKNDITQDRGEQTTWLQRNGFDHIIFDTNEPVATPVLLHELTGTNKDMGFEQQRNMQENKLDAFGFNVGWKATDSLTIALDLSDAKAKSLPNDPITGGSQTAVSVAGMVPSGVLPTGQSCANTTCTNYWTQQFSFNNGLPISTRTLYPTNNDAVANTNGNSNFAFGTSTLGTQVLRLAYQGQTTEIKQGRLDGTFEFSDKSRFQFGVESRSMEMIQQVSNGYMALGDWGVGDVGQVPGMVALLKPYSIAGAFHDYGVAGIPFPAVTGNADTLAQWAITPKASGGGGYGNWSEDTATDGQLRYNPGFSQNNKVKEDTKAIYFQFNIQGELAGLSTNVVAGARYETTDVTSTSYLLVPTSLLWQDDNDFQVNRATTQTPVTGEGKYNNLLPSFNFDIKLTNEVTGRFAYSKTIARANYGNMIAGATVNTPGGSTLNGFTPTANDNNPGLLPLESDNFDLSLEYYFSDTGYVSAGFFDKRVNNFIGSAVFNKPLYGILDQTSGPDAQAALAYLKAHNFGTDDSSLFTAIAMEQNPGTFTDATGTYTGGLTNFNGSSAQHVAFATKYDILPKSGDPLYNFAVQTPVNNKAARIHGFELGGQYFLGKTGFGVLANYTIVRGDVGFDDTGDPNVNQFALTGLSDSANIVLMYEKYGINARLAWNWRDKFLQSINQGGFRNPVYVAPHEQYDLSVGYDLNKHISFSLEGINLTGSNVRWYGRSEKQLWRLEDDGARYAVGARYKF